MKIFHIFQRIKINQNLHNDLMNIIKYMTIPCSVFLICLKSSAGVPELAKISKVEGNGVTISKNRKISVDVRTIKSPELRQYKDSLNIPGNNSGLAHLKFFSGNELISPLVQVGRHQKSSSYTFPCNPKPGKLTLGFGLDKKGNRKDCRAIKIINNKYQVTQLQNPHLFATLQSSRTLLYVQVPANLENYYCGATPTSTMGQGKFSVGLSPEDACQRATEKCQINLGGLVADNSSTPSVTTSAQGGGEEEQQFGNKKPIPLWEDNLDSSISTPVSQTNSNNPCSVANLGDWRVDEPELTVSMLCQNRRSDDSSNRYSLDSITTNGSSVETQLLSLEQKYSGTYLANCEPIVYSRDEIVFVPVQDNTLVQTKDEQGKVVVDVLVGAINLISADFPNGKYVEKGFQYTEGENKLRTIEDCTTIRESEDMQIFLDSDNWSDENSASREEISSQLEAYKANFCQASKVEKKRNSSFPIIIPIFPGGGY